MEKLTAAAFDQLRKDAERGNVRAQFELAGAYYNGNGAARNPAEGARCLLRAAEQGYAPAQCDLGAMYVKGDGVAQSYQEALKWLGKAAEQGDALAQHSLGSIYAKGFRDKSIGFFYRVAFASATRDYVEAYKWFTLAAKNGHPQSLRDRALIAKLWMKDYQISRAEELVREFEQARQGMAQASSDDKSQSKVFEQAPVANGPPRGRITLSEGQRPVIELGQTADASTFVNLSTQQWLDELMRDAAHPQAPDSLVQDARTVLKWFGVVNPDAIETKHRLQFARAFEKYLMEGRAPSGTLAPVFAEYSQVLTKVYGTPQALNVALNDDIRGVFNRLLATPGA
jgi:hypothetical protein